MISRRTALLSGLAAVTACRKARGDGFAGYAFVANQAGNAIAVVDLTAFAVAKHIRLPGSPSAVFGGAGRPFVYALTPADGALHEIDTTRLSVTRTLRVGGTVSGARAEPGGKAFWLLGERRLLRVDPDEMKVTAAIGLPESAERFDISDWTGLAAVTHPASRKVSLASLEEGRVLKSVDAGGEPGAIRFRSDGKALMLANRSERRLTVFDTARGQRLGEVPSGQVMVHLPLAVRPDHLCTHPNGGQIFISGEGRDAVVVIFPYWAPEIAETVLAGSRPGAMTCSGTHLFVTNPSAGDVSILDVDRRKVVAVASVGTEPGHVTLTPDGEYALVLNRKSGDMAVLRIAGLRPDRRKTAPLFTLIPVGSNPVSAVVMPV